MTQDSLENILVVGPSWIGDMVMAQSLFIRLKLKHQNCRISVMAPAWTRPLLERMPEVDRSIDFPFKSGELKLLERRALGKSLNSDNFTTAIVLPNSFKSALIPFHAGIPRRIGWRGEWRDMLLTDCRKLNKDKLPLMVQRFSALADSSFENGLPATQKPNLQTDPASVTATLSDFKLEAGSKILAICPGAEFGAAKQWPAKHFASACSTLIADGWKVWIFGSASDKTIAAAIVDNIESKQQQSCVSLAGRTSLAQAIDLMSVASAVISNDSGLMHIAAALDKPVVALYGSTSPDFTPPLADRVRLLTTDIDCRPCFKRDCPFGHLKCLTELEPARATDAVSELIALEKN
ncbi:MAG: lipopolysaccharide heptosyltransferase II [SAR86 cluster bacterium]|uniref:lipopolysaccharide heptosyltransferase II n=1 Tax=SAR86 cluster bacterium TaxID=2030880 RepID=A0A2A5B290_9GAMM|nr:MAG: lipopolysaccharide heptosyltransferase II [SAR86 cluster bacterium]